MKVLGICGSPHGNGNTAYVLRYALDAFRKAGVETECILLSDKDIHPCNGCFTCIHGTCAINDDMAGVIESLRKCDGLVLASPVYMGMVSGQMKVMMDRSVLLRSSGVFEMSGKVGAGIACAGFRNGGQELTLQNMQTYFLQQNMAVVADGPPFSHSGAALCGEASQDRTGLATVENLVARMMAHLSRR
ncbi:MAG TPA: flavodoxin family protein [Spirochaetia bacterium]|nr:flavodoxin family protein [Spirochaetia bacterium]